MSLLESAWQPLKGQVEKNCGQHKKAIYRNSLHAKFYFLNEWLYQEKLAKVDSSVHLCNHNNAAVTIGTIWPPIGIFDNCQPCSLVKIASIAHPTTHL